MVEQFSSFWSRSAHPSPIVPFYGSPPAVLGRPPIKLFHHDLHQIFNARQFQQQPNAFSQSPRPHPAAEAQHVYNALQFQQQPNGFSQSPMPRPAAEAPAPQKSAPHMLLRPLMWTRQPPPRRKTQELGLTFWYAQSALVSMADLCC